MSRIFFLISILGYSSLVYSWSLDPQKLSSDINTKEAKHPSTEQTKKLLKQLENYESYRPDSWSDAVRRPFHRKRYKFFSDED